MSLEEQEALESAEEQTTDAGQEVAEQFAAADAAADPNEAQPSIEEIASEMGWVPKEKFKGPEEKWKPAPQFIRDGKDIQDRQSRELKGIRETLETIKATNGAIMQERLREEHERLAREYAAAVEKGDPDEAFRAATAIRDVQTRAASADQAPRPEVAPETAAWVERNQRIQKDPVAWRRARLICDAYARDYPSSSPAEQLAYTETHLRREFPYLFDDKPAPQVNGNVTRSTAGPVSKGKTAADLPKEARDLAKDWVERGLIKDEETYAKNYFAQLEKRKA